MCSWTDGVFYDTNMYEVVVSDSDAPFEIDAYEIVTEMMTFPICNGSGG